MIPVAADVRRLSAGGIPPLHGIDSAALRATVPAMSIAELRLLPNSEKLKIIETLWADLSADEASVESPAWHAEELRKTEEDLKAGLVTAVDWDEAKKALRKRFE